MTHAGILQKAIRIAVENGWQGILGSVNGRTYYYPDGNQLRNWRWEENERAFSDGEYDDYESINVEAVIYNHEFAEALWNDTDWRDLDVEECPRPNIENEVGWDGGPEWFEFNGKVWQFHLQQMVVAPDPIAYLREHMPETNK